MKTRTLRRECAVCGRHGEMVYEEPENDSSGEHTRWIEASGCWTVTETGKLKNECEARHA